MPVMPDHDPLAACSASSCAPEGDAVQRPALPAISQVTQRGSRAYKVGVAAGWIEQPTYKNAQPIFQK
jgi:hypothetical protein